MQITNSEKAPKPFTPLELDNIFKIIEVFISIDERIQREKKLKKIKIDKPPE